MLMVTVVVCVSAPGEGSLSVTVITTVYCAVALRLLGRVPVSAPVAALIWRPRAASVEAWAEGKTRLTPLDPTE